jgi:uncharacterized protein YkwD
VRPGPGAQQAVNPPFPQLDEEDFMTSTIRRITDRTLATAVAAAALSGGLALATPATVSAAPADCNYMGYLSGPDRLGLQLDSAEQSVANKINAYRVQNGRAALRVSSILARPTMWASLDDARRGVAPSDHIDSRGMGPAQRAQFCSGYTGPIGEINYWGYGGGPLNNEKGTADAAFAWWKQSPPHNALMLSTQYTTFSVARAYLGVNAERAFWTVDFGTS